MVRSSMSRRLIWMSPAITIPLSSTLSRMSARFAGPPEDAVGRCLTAVVEGGLPAV